MTYTLRPGALDEHGNQGVYVLECGTPVNAFGMKPPLPLSDSLALADAYVRIHDPDSMKTMAEEIPE